MSSVPVVETRVAVKLHYVQQLMYSEQPQSSNLQFSFIHSVSIPPELNMEFEIYYKPAEQWVLLATSANSVLDFDDEKCL